MRQCEIDGCEKRYFSRGMCSMHYARDIYKPKPGDRGTLEERFWRKVVKADGCWGWSGHCADAGYGMIWGGAEVGKPIGAHRVSYIIHNGAISDGAVVMHTCDNPPCCNPAHLKLGTDAANAADKVAKGRHSHGSRRYNAKLTEDAVRFIRSNPAITTADLQRKYNVSQSVISNVRAGVTWRHVT